jgi:drug/metabolite transporter (DMT)-like permease
MVAIRSQFLLLGLSYLFCCVVLLVYTLWQHRGKPNESRPFFRTGAFHPAYLLVGPLGYFVYTVAYNQSSRSFDSISETTILNYTWPVFTILLTDWLLKWKNLQAKALPKAPHAGMIEGIGVGAGFLSVAVLATQGNFSGLHLNLPGILWGLLAGVSYGCFSAYSSTVAEEDQGIFLLTAILASILLISVPALGEKELLRSLTWQDFLLTFFLGGLLDGIGYITWVRANRLALKLRVSISSVASLMLVLPFTSLVIVHLLLGENQLFQPYFFTSLTLILLSSLFCQRPDWVLAVTGMVTTRVGKGKNLGTPPAVG